MSDVPHSPRGIRAVWLHAWALLGTRVSLALLELQQASKAWVWVLVCAGVALVSMFLALLGLTVLCVWWAWPWWGWGALAGVVVFYTLISLVLVWRIVAVARSGQLGLPDTMAELRADQRSLWTSSKS